MRLLKHFLACPRCHGDVEVADNKIECTNTNCGKEFGITNGIPNFLDNYTDSDIRLSIAKWDEFYKSSDYFKGYEKQFQTYLKTNFQNVFKQINKCKTLTKDSVFLEIGCGQMSLSRALADKCKLVMGIDFSLEALAMAKEMLDRNGISNYFLILGDIKRMPLKRDTIDILYGGGVIEHFSDTPTAVKELYRVLKPGGISFNTVPCLNVGTLTYRQLWGNIPNFPVLKQLAEFVHIKVLGARHMKFGYELSFLPCTMRKIHRKAGFSRVAIGNFDTELLFEFVPFKVVRKAFTWLATNSPLFWPMIKVIGFK